MRPGRLERRVWAEGGRRCWLCGRPVSRSEVTMDHRWPKSLGGPYTPDNLAPAHARCNNERGNRVGAELAAFIERIAA